MTHSLLFCCAKTLLSIVKEESNIFLTFALQFPSQDHVNQWSSLGAVSYIRFSFIPLTFLAVESFHSLLSRNVL